MVGWIAMASTGRTSQSPCGPADIAAGALKHDAYRSTYQSAVVETLEAAYYPCRLGQHSDALAQVRDPCRDHGRSQDRNRWSKSSTQIAAGQSLDRSLSIISFSKQLCGRQLHRCQKNDESSPRGDPPFCWGMFSELGYRGRSTDASCRTE